MVAGKRYIFDVVWLCLSSEELKKEDGASAPRSRAGRRKTHLWHPQQEEKQDEETKKNNANLLKPHKSSAHSSMICVFAFRTAVVVVWVDLLAPQEAG